MKYESIAYDLITNQQVYYQSQIMTRSGATEVTQGNGSRISKKATFAFKRLIARLKLP